ncbi:hypothetical protein [Novosphingobium sp. Chol11]|uniref:hypothetical protein n=1 Tax=Novosphingobium sp. Chol11 TaxID=1385763 RepID=UPI0025F0047B|nr:hypothetical protein [Novosphingobium sp. Chol11]
MESCRLALLLAVFSLAACAQPASEQGGDTDPAMTEAIEGQLMVDPDLTQQNMGNLGAVPAGPVDPALPLPDASQPR